ncbi:Panacea domain-containing protein [Leptospira levettii]|uniref:Panacea domain-containing protein n=1 Tax=Leptospira levettii TaxID=2023178 RepID=UPI00143857A3|nr:Panacea domain-containing protein [Leptospira levettii]
METEKLASITATILTIDPHDLSKTKWNKYLFLIDSVYFNSPNGDLKKTLTGLEFIKMPYGPVVKEFNQYISLLKSKHGFQLKSYIGYSSGNMTFIELDQNSKYDTDKLSLFEKQVIAKTVNTFKNYNASELSDLTHEMDAWKNEELFNSIDFSKTNLDQYIFQKTKKNNLYQLLFS